MEPVDTERGLLPNTLSIIPLKDRVLLPSSAMKLTLSSTRSLALVDHLLASSAIPGNLFVGVVPLRRATGIGGSAGAASASNGGQEGGQHFYEEPNDKSSSNDFAEEMRGQLHDIGTAARIIQITRADR